MELNDVTLRKDFNWEMFSSALFRLNLMIGISPILRQHIPIQIIASGGYVSLCALGNRTTTQDLDYFIDPVAYGLNHGEVQRELHRIIRQVAQEMHLVEDWANDQVTLFLSLLRDPKDLFDRSVQQDVRLYSGSNLHIYGVLWLWVLVRKMKRLQMEGQPTREVDWSDCFYILWRMFEDTGEPLKVDRLREFDHTNREPPVFAETVNQLNQLFRQAHGFDGITS